LWPTCLSRSLPPASMKDMAGVLELEADAVAPAVVPGVPAVVPVVVPAVVVPAAVVPAVVLPAVDDDGLADELSIMAFVSMYLPSAPLLRHPVTDTSFDLSIAD